MWYHKPGGIAAFCLLCCAFSAAEHAWFFGMIQRSPETPAPINCELTSWSNWTECDPCTNQKFRSRSIVKFGQFGGSRCLSSLGEYQRCKSDHQCAGSVLDCGNDFECETSGRCIKTRFLCNGDNDCGDHSDETCDDGKDPKPVCRNMDVDLSEIARTAGDGFNFLGMETKRNPFDNEYYNGICDRVRDGNTKTYYRKPWNVAALVYQTKADKSFTTETFDDSVSLVTKLLKEHTQTLEVSLSFKTSPSDLNGTTIGANAGLKHSKNESIQTLKEYSQKTNKQYLRVTGEIQLGTFQMRTRGAMVSTVFVEDLNNLPPFYQKTEYFAFLEMYGTHYATSGVVGGKYDLIYVLDSKSMETKEVTDRTVTTCLGFNAGIKVEAKGINIAGDVKPTDCEKLISNTAGDTKSDSVIEHVVSFVEGGTIDFATVIQEKLSRRETNIDVDLFVKWAHSLIDAPAVIKRKLSPIYTLVPIDLRDAYIKTKNLERAIEDYVDEYNVCKCQLCKNGGTLVLLDGECMCTCPLGYHGIACETVAHDLAKKPMEKDHHGRWGCWKSSSSCVDNEETRTRTCENNDGKACVGENTRKVPC
ncbi:complement component C9 [Ranitomeya imitator]|uniref:complement component C9 n=1 Tax=Ranitomeya imitator TaxID=111125 RepID=UPI0037E736DD